MKPAHIVVHDGSRPVDQLNELEFVKGEIYANVWHDDRIARISPRDGKVLGWIDLAGILPANQRVQRGIRPQRYCLRQRPRPPLRDRQAVARHLRDQTRSPQIAPLRWSHAPRPCTLPECPARVDPRGPHPNTARIAAKPFGIDASVAAGTHISLQENEESWQQSTRKVKSIIVEQLQVDEAEVTPGASFQEDLGADSLDVVELVMQFEEAFDIQIPDEDAEKIKTVKDATDYIEAHAKAK